MTTHTPTRWDPTPADRYPVEDALETLPYVDRACVARTDDHETVVLVRLDPTGTVPAEIGAAMAQALADHGLDPAAVRVRVAPGWLPGRDAFPARIRRSCARARYAPLLVTILVPLTTPMVAL